MSYEYKKKKYKAVTIQLDREREADLISVLEGSPEGPKAFIVTALRFYISFISSIALGGAKHGQ